MVSATMTSTKSSLPSTSHQTHHRPALLLMLAVLPTNLLLKHNSPIIPTMEMMKTSPPYLISFSTSVKLHPTPLPRRFIPSLPPPDPLVLHRFLPPYHCSQHRLSFSLICFPPYHPLGVFTRCRPPHLLLCSPILRPIRPFRSAQCLTSRSQSPLPILLLTNAPFPKLST